MELDLSARQRLRGVLWPVHADHMLAIVGEAPGPNTRSDCPFYPSPPTSAAGRFLSCIGWSRSEYLLTFARINLLSEYPGKRFPVSLARSCVPAAVSLLHPRPMLLMGRGVARAFKLDYLEPLTWLRVPLKDVSNADVSARVAIVPHPSGRNRWYNDQENCARLRRFIYEARAECQNLSSVAACARQ